MTRQASPHGLTWFQDARFGMFIHWGLYSIIGKQEWVMHTDRIPVPEYEKLVPQFNPTQLRRRHLGAHRGRRRARSTSSSPAAIMTASACTTPRSATTR